MKEREITSCLIEYSQKLNKEYNCNVNFQINEKEKSTYEIKVFLTNIKLGLVYTIILDCKCNVKDKFESMLEWYKDKCAKWCGQEG